MTLFPDNDTSVKRSKNDGAIPMWAFLPKATCRILDFVKRGFLLTMVQNELFSEWQRKSIVINGQRTRVYDIGTITLEQFRLLIACGNDSHNNQIRVTKSGMVYLSEDIVGSEQLDGVALSFETFHAGGGYVGVKAAEDNSHVIPLFHALKRNWTEGISHAYIDIFD